MLDYEVNPVKISGIENDAAQKSEEKESPRCFRFHKKQQRDEAHKSEPGYFEAREDDYVEQRCEYRGRPWEESLATEGIESHNAAWSFTMESISRRRWNASLTTRSYRVLRPDARA